ALGEAHERLAAVADAKTALRRAWECETAFPYMLTNARRRLALLIVMTGDRQFADEALDAVGLPGTSAGERVFPFVAAECSLVRAAVASWRGDRAGAAAFAAQGLAAAL